MRMVGYTRVGTRAQDAQLQRDALLGAGVQERDTFADATSGARAAIARPKMRRLLEYVAPGDTADVWRIDRLGRSLLDVLDTLRQRDVQVRSLSDGIDPSSCSTAVSSGSTGGSG